MKVPTCTVNVLKNIIDAVFFAPPLSGFSRFRSHLLCTHSPSFKIPVLLPSINNSPYRLDFNRRCSRNRYGDPALGISCDVLWYLGCTTGLLEVTWPMIRIKVRGCCDHGASIKPTSVLLSPGDQGIRECRYSESLFWVTRTLVKSSMETESLRGS